MSAKGFVSQERVSGFPEKGLTSGEVRETSGKSGELPGKSGKLPGNPWIAVKFHSERTSGEVAEKLPGKSGEVRVSSGDFPEARGSLTPSQRLAKFFCVKCQLDKCQARKKSTPKLLRLDIFQWVRGLPHEGAGAKELCMSLEPREIKLFWRDIPGFCRDIPAVPENLREIRKIFFRGRNFQKNP